MWWYKQSHRIIGTVVNVEERNWRFGMSQIQEKMDSGAKTAEQILSEGTKYDTATATTLKTLKAKK